MILKVIWSSLAMFLTSATCRLSDLQKQQSISRNFIDVNRRKIERYARYLWNFDQLLGLPGCLQRYFDVGNVSSLRKWWRESVATTVALSRGASVTTISISPFHGIPTILHVHLPTPTTRRDSNEETEVDTCNPRRKVI